MSTLIITRIAFSVVKQVFFIKKRHAHVLYIVLLSILGLKALKFSNGAHRLKNDHHMLTALYNKKLVS